MICENAYYKDGDKKLSCSSKRKLEEDQVFKDRCPLIYLCRISGKFENTADFTECPYREKNQT